MNGSATLPRPRAGPARDPRRGQSPAAQLLRSHGVAQLRLCARFRRLAARKTSKNLVVAAIARELAGFLWAEMTA
jgi:transposase